MSLLQPDDIEVGIRGQRITVRGIRTPREGDRYTSEQELDLSLPQAREVLRLLTELIPLAEQSKPASVSDDP
jgi:hypothetical protein